MNLIEKVRCAAASRSLSLSHTLAFSLAGNNNVSAVPFASERPPMPAAKAEINFTKLRQILQMLRVTFATKRAEKQRRRLAGGRAGEKGNNNCSSMHNLHNYAYFVANL